MSDLNSTTPLIHTGSRKNLPRGLSHPIGAEAISRALAGYQRIDELSIAFRDKPEQLHTPPKGCDGFSLAFSVDAVSGYFLGERWHLIVPAVPSTSRYVVRQLLELAGLAGVREWLLRPRPETWYSRIRQFQIGYALNPPRICLVEYEVKRWMGSEVKRVIESVVREISEARTARRVNPPAPNPDATPERG